MTARVWAEWRNRVVAEYRSAASAAAVVHDGIVAGLPAPLLHTGLRIVRDELDHAELSHRCLEALGGGDAPIPLTPAELVGPRSDHPLADLVDAVVREFCLGETLAVPLFAAMRRDASHPAVVPVLTRILADEAIHRQFGWDALDALLERDPDGVRDHVAARLPGWLAGYRASYAPDDADTGPDALTPDERAAGLLAVPQYRAVFWDTVTGDLGRRLAARGLSVAGLAPPGGAG
ncbi:MAG: ferritin-like domain-containing protein [Myxococcota bacterium]